jgi:hypothetical protein
LVAAPIQETGSGLLDAALPEEEQRLILEPVEDPVSWDDRGLDRTPKPLH